MINLEERGRVLFDGTTKIDASPIGIPLLIFLPSNEKTPENVALAERGIAELKQSYKINADAYLFGFGYQIDESPRVAIPIQFYQTRQG